jgi:hypothetical protein
LYVKRVSERAVWGSKRGVCGDTVKIPRCRRGSVQLAVDVCLAGYKRRRWCQSWPLRVSGGVVVGGALRGATSTACRSFRNDGDVARASSELKRHESNALSYGKKAGCKTAATFAGNRFSKAVLKWSKIIALIGWTLC